MSIVECFCDDCARRAEARSENPKDRCATKKVDPALVPPVLVLHASVALEEGSDKYGPFNWRDPQTPVRASVYYGAMIRHLSAWIDGQDYDPDNPRKHHLAAVAASCAILLDAMENGTLVDDRVPGPASGVVARLTRPDEE